MKTKYYRHLKQHFNSPYFISGCKICFHENQSDVEKEKSTLVTGIQEFNKDGKPMGFVYELKQTSPWTQYYTENNQMYTIRQHTDYFAWGELMSLTMMYLGHFLSN